VTVGWEDVAKRQKLVSRADLWIHPEVGCILNS